MTPTERARNIHVRACQCGATGICATHAAIAYAITEERDACMRDMCPYCHRGEPIVEPAECIAMGHYYNDSIICHPFDRDKEGRVTGHVGCAAAAIRIRGQA